jgi:hypothetical protein
MKPLVNRIAVIALALAASLAGCKDDTPVTDPVTPLAQATDLAKFTIPAMTVGTKIADIDLAGIVTGGKTPYTYTATGLPAGLALSGSKITGTPTAEGAAGSAKITVKDSSTPAQSKEVTISFGAVAAAHPAASAFYGSWKSTTGGSTGTVTIAADKIIYIHSYGSSYTIEGLTWTPIDEPNGNTTYPKGYKIVGKVTAKTWDMMGVLKPSFNPDNVQARHQPGGGRTGNGHLVSLHGREITGVVVS